jgi:hypothetical protein
MKTACFLLFASALVVLSSGCAEPKSVAPATVHPAPAAIAPAKSADPLDLVAKYQTHRPPGVSTLSPEPVAPARQRKVEPLPIDGIWVPSGWMGDGEVPGGALEFNVSTKDPHSPPTCDGWRYDPSRGTLGWAAVAYQLENNWGSAKGQDLSRKGFTRITFFARGKNGDGNERLIFKSGGHTARNAAFPASYESTSGAITLSKTWEQFSISLVDLDLSNTATAFAFAVNRQLCPYGCEFYLDDITFCGPDK